MSRKNIFEIVNGIFDVSIELNRLYRLFEGKETVRSFLDNYTLRDYIFNEGFATWRNRGRCVDLNDFLSLLEFDKLWDTAKGNTQDFFTLIEIIYNFWHIAERKASAAYGYDERAQNFRLLKKIMDECLAYYNYRGEYFRDLEQLIVIEDKPEATAVAEIVDNELGIKVLRYNHYMLKGNLQAKKDILLALGADVEPKRKQIKLIDKDLEDGIFYILNNLHLRHNNKTEGDKYYNQATADMDESTLEFWYDELYQMILLAYLQLDQVNRNVRFKELKKLITP